VCVELVDLRLLARRTQPQAVARALGQRDVRAVDRERNQADRSRQGHGFRHPRPREAAGDPMRPRRKSHFGPAIALDYRRSAAVDGNVQRPCGPVAGQRQHARCEHLDVLRELRAIRARPDFDRSGPDADPAVRRVDAPPVQHRAAKMLAAVEHPALPAAQFFRNLERLRRQRAAKSSNKQPAKQTAHWNPAYRRADHRPEPRGL
jgi:hypothetical protein